MDKTIRKTTLVLLLCSVLLHAREGSDFFTRGNSAYERADIPQAIDYYRVITHKGPAVWYNMGNCYYHQQDFAHAIACWQRSLNGSSYHDYIDAKKNIVTAQRLLGIETVNDSITDFFYAVADMIPVMIAQWLLLIFWLFLWLMVVYRYRIRFLNLCFFGILVIVLFLGLVVYLQWSKERCRSGIVVTKDMALLAGPNQKYHGLGTVAYGQMVYLIEQRPGWYKIRKYDKYGWVAASAIELVQSP